MDDGALRRVQEELVAWGLLEPAGPPQLTRRLRGAIARASGELQALEMTGRAPPGSALENAIEHALTSFPLPEDAELGHLHRKFLLAVEVASLPPSVRQVLGV